MKKIQFKVRQGARGLVRKRSIFSLIAQDAARIVKIAVCLEKQTNKPTHYNSNEARCNEVIQMAFNPEALIQLQELASKPENEWVQSMGQEDEGAYAAQLNKSISVLQRQVALVESEINKVRRTKDDRIS